MNEVLTVTELDRQLGIPGVARVSEGSGGVGASRDHRRFR